MRWIKFIKLLLILYLAFFFSAFFVWQYFLCRIILPLLRLTAFSKEVTSVFIVFFAYLPDTYCASLLHWRIYIYSPATPRIHQQFYPRDLSVAIQQHGFFFFSSCWCHEKWPHYPKLGISHLSSSSCSVSDIFAVNCTIT